MKCLFLPLFLLISVATAWCQGSRFDFPVGYIPATPGTANTESLNTAASGGYSATWLDFGFRLRATKTINSFTVYVSATAGSPATTDFYAETDTDSSGNPSGTAIENCGTTCISSVPASTGATITLTGFSGSYSANTQYHLVIKNANSAPTTNYETYRYGGNNQGQVINSYENTLGWNAKTTTNSGSTWTASSDNIWGLRINFSDGTYDGFMATASSTTGASLGAYGSNENGEKFITPSNGVSMNVCGLSFGAITVTGTPGNLQFRLYTGSSSPTLIGTTETISNGSVGGLTNGWVKLNFTSSISIAPNTTVRVTYGDSTSTDTSSNRYNTDLITIDGTSGSESLVPFGNASGTYLSSGTFTDTATNLVPFALDLCGSNPFSASTSCANACAN